MGTDSRNGVSNLVVLVAVVLVALNLRPALASVPPLLEVVRADLSVSYAAVSLLTTIPVLCMGLFALLAPAVSRHVSRERGVFWSLVVITLATAARLGGHSALVLFGSTVLVGVAIALVQTFLPALVGQYFPDRPAFATGLYSAAMAGGATLASGLTVPVETLVGPWTVALALWAVPAVVAVLAWLPVLRSPRSRDDTVDDGAQSSATGSFPVGEPLAWLLVLFHGGTSTLFYSILTWLPSRYIALAWSAERAGLVPTVFLLVQPASMLLLSALGDRSPDRRPWIAGLHALTVLGAAGIAWAPLAAPWTLATVLGLGIGGLFTLSLTLPIDFAAGGDATDRLSSMVFAGGYTLAAAGPGVVGVVRDAGGSYELVFAGFAAVGVGLFVTALSFSPRRDRIGG
jgi:CP family cyanate transporter-like MFS transporter